MERSRSRKAPRTAALFLTLLAAVCVGCCHSNSSTPSAQVAALNGTVYESGPVANATVQLFNVNPDGTNNGGPLATTTTDANGKFHFDMSPGQTFRVCATNGSFTDKATGKTIDNALTLCALVPGGTATVNDHLISTFGDQIAKGELMLLTAPTQADLTQARDDANGLVKDYAGLTQQAFAVEPLFTPPNTQLDPTGDRYRLGALLAAFGQLAENYVQNCGQDSQDILEALVQDVLDKVLDGRTFDPMNPTQTLKIQVTCNGMQEDMALGTGTADLLTALDQFAAGMGTMMQISQNSALLDPLRAGVASGPLAPTVVKVVPSQGLIAIDTANNVAYVPIYSQDTMGNAQVALVDLNPSASTPVLGVLSLDGSIQPVATTIDPLAKRAYIEGRKSDNSVTVYVVNTVTRTVIQSLDVPGVTQTGNFGGIIANPAKMKVIVAGTNEIALLDTSSDPVSVVPNSVLDTGGTDSISLNLDTEVLFIASDGSNKVVDTSVVPPVLTQFMGGLGTTDGNAFDTVTNTLILDPEFQDQTHVFNMSELDLTGTATAPFVTVPGLGATGIHGEGPGGQAVINILNHQGIVADEFGQNFKLIQLPTAPYAGAPNNNGQPGTMTTADGNSAYTIAAAILPMVDTTGDGTPDTTVGIRGDPNSLTVDPVRNRLYALVDAMTSYNSWPAGSDRPLYLAQVDLSNPVLGASPTGMTQWTPNVRYIRMP